MREVIRERLGEDERLTGRRRAAWGPGVDDEACALHTRALCLQRRAGRAEWREGVKRMNNGLTMEGWMMDELSGALPVPLDEQGC